MEDRERERERERKRERERGRERERQNATGAGERERGMWAMEGVSQRGEKERERERDEEKENSDVNRHFVWNDRRVNHFSIPFPSLSLSLYIYFYFIFLSLSLPLSLSSFSRYIYIYISFSLSLSLSSACLLGLTTTYLHRPHIFHIHIHIYTHISSSSSFIKNNPITCLLFFTFSLPPFLCLKNIVKQSPLSPPALLFKPQNSKLQTKQTDNTSTSITMGICVSTKKNKNVSSPHDDNNDKKKQNEATKGVEMESASKQPICSPNAIVSDTKARITSILSPVADSYEVKTPPRHQRGSLLNKHRKGSEFLGIPEKEMNLSPIRFASTSSETVIHIKDRSSSNASSTLSQTSSLENRSVDDNTSGVHSRTNSGERERMREREFEMDSEIPCEGMGFDRAFYVDDMSETVMTHATSATQVASDIELETIYPSSDTDEISSAVRVLRRGRRNSTKSHSSSQPSSREGFTEYECNINLYLHKIASEGVLDLSGCQIGELSIPLETPQDELEKIRVLRLHNNCLSSLPHTISRMTKLVVIHAEGNPLISIPSSFHTLRRLRKIWVDSHCMQHLASLSREFNGILCADDTALTPLPSPIYGLPPIKRRLTIIDDSPLAPYAEASHSCPPAQ